MFRANEKQHNHDDLRPVARVLNNALDDMAASGDRQTGFQCFDIAVLGYSQREAIDGIFHPPSDHGPAARLAEQVCQRCIMRVYCDQAAAR